MKKSLIVLICVLSLSPQSKAIDMVDALTNPASLDYIIYHDALVGGSHSSEPAAPLTPEQIQKNKEANAKVVKVLLSIFGVMVSFMACGVCFSILESNPVYRLRKFPKEEQEEVLKFLYDFNEEDLKKYFTLSFREKTKMLRKNMAKRQIRLAGKRC